MRLQSVNSVLRGWVSVFALLTGFASHATNAQTALLNEVHTVAVPTAAAPAEFSFTADSTHAGTLTVTLTDLGAVQDPTAAMTAVALQISSGNSAVPLTFPSGATPATGTALNAAGSATFTATSGASYVIHVVGVPVAVTNSGLIDVQIKDAGGAQYQDFSATLAPPGASIPNNLGVLDSTFTVPAGGNYTVALTDFQLPQSLGVLTAIVIPVGGGTPTLILPTTGGQYSDTQPLTAGVTYHISAVAQLANGSSAGLYGITVAPAATPGTVTYGQTIPVGAMTLVGAPTLPAANYTLKLSDPGFPAALTQLGAVVTQNGTAVAQLTAAGSSPSTAYAAGTYQVFAAAAPAAGGTGSYSVSLQPAVGSPALSVTRAVAAFGGPVTAYSYDTTLVAEPYTLQTTDFGIPAQLTVLQAAVIQNGAVVGSLTAAGTKSLTATAGSASILVFAQAPSAGGLFGINLSATGAGAAAFETTQGVGSAFTGRKVTVGQGGNYQVTVNDLGFPDHFGSLWVVVTRGVDVSGQVFGSGSTTFAATGGSYFVNFIAQPSNSVNNKENAGTYAIAVAPAPPAPTLTLQASASTAKSGTTVTLTWSTQNATSCAASGGWSGTQPVNGPATSPAITANTTFTLMCTGPGGSTTQSATVTLDTSSTDPTPGKGGGGGAIGLPFLAFLLLFVAGRAVAIPRYWRGTEKLCGDSPL